MTDPPKFSKSDQAHRLKLDGKSLPVRLLCLANCVRACPFRACSITRSDLPNFDRFLRPDDYSAEERADALFPKGTKSITYMDLVKDVVRWHVGSVGIPSAVVFSMDEDFQKACVLGDSNLRQWIATWEAFSAITGIDEMIIIEWMKANNLVLRKLAGDLALINVKLSFRGFATDIGAYLEERQSIADKEAKLAAPRATTPAAAARVHVAAVDDHVEPQQALAADVIAAAVAQGVREGIKQAQPKEKRIGGYGPSNRGGHRTDGVVRHQRAFYADCKPVRGTTVCEGCGNAKHGACSDFEDKQCFFCKNHGHVAAKCKHPGAVEMYNKYTGARYPALRKGVSSARGRRQNLASLAAVAVTAPRSVEALVGGASAERDEANTTTTPLFTRVWLGAGRVATVACVDTGANRVCIQHAVLEVTHPNVQLSPYTGNVADFQGDKGVPPVGEAVITVSWAADGSPARTVTVLVFKHLFAPLIIGTDLQLAASMRLKVGRSDTYVKFDGVKLAASVMRQERVKARCFAANKVTLQPGINANVMVNFFERFPSGVASVWPAERPAAPHSFVASAVYTVQEGRRQLPLTILCTAKEPVTIQRGASIAEIYSDVVGAVTVAGATFPATNDGPQGLASQFVAVAAAATAHVPAEGKDEVWKAILQKLSEMDPTLDGTQRAQAEALFWQYREQFVLQLEGAGAADLPPHQIKLVPGATPPRIPVLRLSPAERVLLWKELDSLLRMKAVRAATSTAFAAPMLLVEKPNSPVGPDGRREMRVVIDYRALNKITQQEYYPLPLRQEVLDKLGKAAYFTTFDLASGYYQMPIVEEDRHKSGFTVPGRGVFEWCVTAMGLMNAPPSFQRAMEVVLSGLNWICCLVFIDDIIIFSATWEDHLRDVAAVLKRFADVGLKIKITKCQIARTSVKFLGAVVSRAGIAPDPARVSAIKDARAPTSLAETRRFLGLCNWLRDFGGARFADAVQPIYDTLRRRKNWQWSEAADVGFRRVKQLLSSAPILCHPDFSRPFAVYADASDVGHGGILFQAQSNGVGGVIAYHSGRWSDAERKYSTSQMETLTLGILCKEWRPYLYGSNFDVFFYSDHQPVKGILEGRTYDHGRLDRVRAELQDFLPRMKIQYIKGPKNPADALTREPVLIAPLRVAVEEIGHPAPVGAPTVTVQPSPPISTPVVAAASHGGAVAYNELTTAAQLCTAQSADPEIQPYLAYCDKGAIPSSLSEGDRKRFLDVAERMGRTSEGVLFIKANVPPGERTRRGEGAAAQLFMPVAYRKDLLFTFHERLGHLKAERLADLLRRYYWWPTLHRDAAKWVAECVDCQRTVNNRKDFGSLHPHGANRPFQVMALDLATCGDGDGGFRCFVVMVDLFSKWVEGRPLPNGTQEEVIKAVDDLWVSRFGPPEIFLTDNGANLVGGKMEEYLAHHHTKHVTITEYHPQANGQAEHTVKMVKSALLAMVSLHQKDWPQHFSGALAQMRMAKNSSTGMSPFFLMFGRAPTLPVPAPLRALREEQSAEEVAAKRALEQARNEEAARQSLEVARAEMKARYDRRHAPAKWAVGQLVWKRRERALPGEVRALQPEWEGPYVIKSAGKSDDLVVYLAANPDQEKRATSDQLKPYLERSDQRVEAPVAEDTFEVEEIWQEAPLGAGRQYLVKWKGYPPSAMTWEPEVALEGSELFARFKQRPEQERRAPPKGKTVPKKVKRLQEVGDVHEPVLHLEEGDGGAQSRSGRKLRVPAHQKSMIYLGAVNARNLFSQVSNLQLALRA